MKLKGLRLLLLLLVCLQSCAQKEVKMDKIAGLYKGVKYQDEKISYHADYVIGGCHFEVLINGYPIERYYGNGRGSMGSSSPINCEILKSGEQTWEVRVFPVSFKDVEQKVIGKGARIKLKIQGVRFDKDGNVGKKYPLALDFSAPLVTDVQTGENNLEAAGKPFMVYKGVFKAEVPYELEGWTKGEEFSLKDSVALKKEVLAKFKELGGIITNNEGRKYEDLILNKEREVAQCFFFEEEKSKDIAKSYSECFNNSLKNKEVKELTTDNTDLRYYCGNKLITLYFSKKACLLCEGKESLYISYKDGESNRSTRLQTYLYRPKKGGPLEIIR